MKRKSRVYRLKLTRSKIGLKPGKSAYRLLNRVGTGSGVGTVAEEIAKNGALLKVADLEVKALRKKQLHFGKERTVGVL